MACVTTNTETTHPSIVIFFLECSVNTVHRALSDAKALLKKGFITYYNWTFTLAHAY